MEKLLQARTSAHTIPSGRRLELDRRTERRIVPSDRLDAAFTAETASRNDFSLIPARALLPAPAPAGGIHGPARIYRQKAGAAKQRPPTPQGGTTYDEAESFTKAGLSTKTRASAQGYVSGSATGKEVVDYLESRGLAVKVPFVAFNEDLPDKDPMATGTYRPAGSGAYDVWVSCGFKVPDFRGGPDTVKNRDPDAIAKTLLHELLHAGSRTNSVAGHMDVKPGIRPRSAPLSRRFGITTYEKEEEYEPEFLEYLKRPDRELREEIERARERRPVAGAPQPAPPR